MAMALVRRLSRTWAIVVASGLFLTPELGDIGIPRGVANVLFMGGAAKPGVFFDYPVLPWVGVMALGYLWGDFVLTNEATVTRIGRYARMTLLPMLAVYFVVRAANGFGNAGAPRVDGSLQQWLNVSTNPPSLLVLAMYPLCRWYASYKPTHDNILTRYV